ncbi:hypothetical protein [Nocardioides marmoraquaticus]
MEVRPAGGTELGSLAQPIRRDAVLVADLDAESVQVTTDDIPVDAVLLRDLLDVEAGQIIGRDSLDLCLVEALVFLAFGSC